MDGKLAIETIQSFQTLLSKEDFDEFIKGTDSEKLRAFPEVQEFLKGETSPEIKSPTAEKNDKKGGSGTVDPGGKEAEEKDDKQNPDGGDTEDREGKNNDFKKKEKAVETEISKAFQDEVNGKLKEVTSILQKNIDNATEIAGIKKSVDSLLETVNKIAGAPLGTKAIRTGNAEWLEKSLSGELKDDDDKQVLSVSVNKVQIEKALATAMDKTADPELKKSYEDSLLRYNAGGGTISKDVAFDLVNTYNIRLTQ